MVTRHKESCGPFINHVIVAAHNVPMQIMRTMGHGVPFANALTRAEPIIPPPY